MLPADEVGSAYQAATPVLPPRFPILKYLRLLHELRADERHDFRFGYLSAYGVDMLDLRVDMLYTLQGT